jgi:hypothetical protein
MAKVIVVLSMSLDGYVGGPVPLVILRVVDAPGVTQLRYRVVRGS